MTRKNFFILLTFVITPLTVFGTGFGGRIKHVIAIMFENRSFDHMLGFLKKINSDYDGCLPSMSQCVNPYNPLNTSIGTVSIGDNAVYIQPGDPSHGIDPTTQQLYGTNEYGNNINNYPAPMNGFVINYKNAEDSSIRSTDQGALIMQCFNSSTVPIISTLAQEFGSFNNWYADVPGPTEPNRLYSWMATSDGLGNDNAHRLALGFDKMSIFQMLDEYYNKSSDNNWRVYMSDGATPIFVDYTRKHPLRYREMPAFYDDVENGDLPLFTWIDPGYLENNIVPPSSQHPDFDVLDGEKQMKKIYEHVRASNLWNDTLILIFYDEHGGFYDHVSPPFGPNPDNKNCTVGPNFDFQRIGLRVPSILISPWINKGLIITDPGNNHNHNASQYTHSSLVKTMRQQYAPQCPPFTKRDSWALSFEKFLMQRDEPRTDCPMKLPDIPDIGIATVDNGYIQNLRPTDFHISIADTIAPLCGKTKKDVDQYSTTQPLLRQFIVNCMREWTRNA